MNSINNTRWRLDGKTAILTGATRGIGLAAARDLLDLRAKVLIVARNDIEQDTKRQPDYTRRGENKIIFDWGINDGICGIDIMSGANRL